LLKELLGSKEEGVIYFTNCEKKLCHTTMVHIMTRQKSQCNMIVFSQHGSPTLSTFLN